MDEIIIWRAVKQTLDMFGSDAADQSGRRAGTLMDQGDIESFEMWKRVAAALSELERTEPRKGEAAH